jgi:sigma-B regulation protein RsbU (phosphoserine phosphatase)
MASLPPVKLGVIISLAFLIVLVLRKPLERSFVEAAEETSQSKRQFLLDLSLYFLVGIFASAYNVAFFNFPLYSTGSLIFGCLIAGYFLSLDTALARERKVIHDASARDHVLPPPERLYSMTRKFSLVALTATVLVSIVLFLVFSRDIIWLSEIGHDESALARAQLAVAYEILFIMGVLLALVVNLIISYSGNLKLLFENETGILKRVSQGDLSQKVPVATQDEFGFIAGHTNSMIEGLRHRIELMSSLKLAEEVQQNLLPQRPPEIPGADIAGSSLYCDETGGDYYDFFQLPQGKWGIVVADASGHGVGAAMHMTTVRAFLHYGIRDYRGPAGLLNTINQYVTRDSEPTSRFMSLFFLEVDISNRTLCWVRAGHEPALVCDPQGNNFQELSGEGMALGITDDYVYIENTAEGWSAGSVVVIGTDGIHELRNESGEMFGLKRLRDIITETASRSAEAIQQAVIETLRNFQGQAPQEDDITLVVLKLL